MALTQLECFNATVGHCEHEGFLFHADFTPDLDRRIREELGVDDTQSLYEYFGMYTPVGGELCPPVDYSAPDFSGYFRNMDSPENAFINGLGILEIPGSMYHFTRYVSPLRNAIRFEEIASFPYPNVDGFSADEMPAHVRKCHEQGKVAQCWTGHMYEDSCKSVDTNSF